MQKKSLKTIDLCLPTGSLEGYIAYVNRIPMLSQEYEQLLATRLRADNDLDAAKELILAHLRYVVRVAKGYSGYGLAIADLIQEGNIGLMKAVKRFDPTVGVRLVTFAVHWIKAEMHEFILRHWRIVKVVTTKAQRKLFFKLRGQKKRLGWFTKEEVEAVAQDLGVKPQTVLEMEARLHATDAAFDGVSTQEDDDYLPAPADYLQDTRFSADILLEQSDGQEKARDALYKALPQLDERSQTILQARWLTEDKATLETLGTQLNVSIERVRQLEKNAIKKLKSLMGVTAEADPVTSAG